jgi:predicted XRE-type DNA-binding protein
MTEHAFDNIWDALEPDPIERANLQLRSQLLSALIDVLEQNGMTQTATLLGIDEPCLTNLMAGRIDLFTIDNLVNMLEKTGRHITLSIAETVKVL